MSFYSKMNETVNNVSVTENGMVGYKTTYHPLLDMNFKIASYRSKSDLDPGYPALFTQSNEPVTPSEL